MVRATPLAAGFAVAEHFTRIAAPVVKTSVPAPGPAPAGHVEPALAGHVEPALAGHVEPALAGHVEPAAHFREAAAAVLDDLGGQPAASAPLVQANLGQMRTTVLAALDPTATIEAPLLRRLSVAGAVARRGPDPLAPILAAPDFPQPMYEALRDLSQEWLLPSLAEVPPNTLTLLRANARFIEAYLIGLNHEMGRILLWSEYPTDQRGTYFRRFWDSAARLPADATPDIPPIHTWSRTAALGQSLDGKAGNAPLLLLVRGDLLHRYPNTAVYAVRAAVDKQRILLGSGESGNRVRAAVDDNPRTLGSEEKHPLFGGSFSPDIAFFAFDLDVAAARGSDKPGDLGWFFVLQEPAGEPRFGLEAGAPGQAPPQSLAQLSWGHLAADAAGLARIHYVDLNADLPDLRSVADAGGLVWHADRGLGPTGAKSSHLARIGLRPPARIAVHASEMLLGPQGH
jgi:hypothetical protein